MTQATFHRYSNGSGWASLANGETVEFISAGVVPFTAWCRKVGVSPATVSQSNGSTRRQPVSYHAPVSIVETAQLSQEQVGSLRVFASQVEAREQALECGHAMAKTGGYLNYWSLLGYEVR